MCKIYITSQNTSSLNGEKKSMQMLFSSSTLGPLAASWLWDTHHGHHCLTFVPILELVGFSLLKNDGNLK